MKLRRSPDKTAKHFAVAVPPFFRIGRSRVDYDTLRSQRRRHGVGDCTVDGYTSFVCIVVCSELYVLQFHVENSCSCHQLPCFPPSVDNVNYL